MIQAANGLHYKFILRTAPGTGNNAGTRRDIFHPGCSHFRSGKGFAAVAAACRPFQIICFRHFLHSRICFFAFDTEPFFNKCLAKNVPTGLRLAQGQFASFLPSK
jgi:hypothetical protein